MKKKKYEAPQTRYLEVELEGGFCVGSKEEVVEEENTTASIEEQQDGGTFEWNTWN